MPAFYASGLSGNVGITWPSTSSQAQYASAANILTTASNATAAQNAL